MNNEIIEIAEENIKLLKRVKYLERLLTKWNGGLGPFANDDSILYEEIEKMENRNYE